MRYDQRVAHAVRAFLVALLVTSVPRAYQPTFDLQAVNDAIAIGQSRVESVRLRFHEPYRIRVAQPPVDYVDVVTPFRRVVLAAEERARVGLAARWSCALTRGSSIRWVCMTWELNLEHGLDVRKGLREKPHQEQNQY